MQRIQHNITLSDDQIEVIKSEFGKVKNAELAKKIGVTYNKLHNNLRLMKLVVTREDTECHIEGNFNLREFAKHYKY